MFRCQSPLDGEGLEDIAITGSGILTEAAKPGGPLSKEADGSQWIASFTRAALWMIRDCGGQRRDGKETLAWIEQTGSQNPQDYGLSETI